MLKFLDEPDSGKNFLIIPVPYERTTSFQTGTEEAPQYLLKISSQLELFDSELGFEVFPQAGISTADPVKVDTEDPAEAMQYMEEKFLALLQKETFPIFIGGEHSLTLPAARALRKILGPFSLIYLDGHLDLREEYEGNKFSHACVARRLVEEGFRIYFIGSRCYSKEELDFAENNSSLFLLDGLDELPKNEKFYLSFDFDVIEPSVFEAATAPCPWGLNLAEVKEILKKASSFDLVGADFVEFMPVPFASSGIIAVDLIYKFIGWVYENKKGGKG